MEKAHFTVNMVIVKAGRLVKIKIATGRKVQVKKMIALTVIWGSYQLHEAFVLSSLFFPLFHQSSTASFRL